MNNLRLSENPMTYFGLKILFINNIDNIETIIIFGLK